MFSLHLILLSVGILLYCLSAPAQGQLLEKDVPKSLKFLYEGDLDTWKPPAEFNKQFPIYLSGYDADNKPIWIAEFGKWQIRNYIHRGEHEQLTLEKYADKYVYLLLQSLGDRATPNKAVKESVVIFDMDGYSQREMSSPKVIALIYHVLQRVLRVTNYVDEWYFVNCNRVADNIISMFRPLLGRHEKIIVYGTNKKNWMPLLGKRIPTEALPPSLRGSKDFVPVKWVG